MPAVRVVVFDDDELFLTLFTRIFKSKNFQVKTYANPSLYFCMHSQTDSCPVDAPCTDFLLTDHMMPGMTGIEFLEKTRRMRCKIPDERKAIISANLTEEEYEKAKRLIPHVFHKSEAKEQIALWVAGFSV